MKGARIFDAGCFLGYYDPALCGDLSYVKGLFDAYGLTEEGAFVREADMPVIKSVLCKLASDAMAGKLNPEVADEVVKRCAWVVNNYSFSCRLACTLGLSWPREYPYTPEEVHGLHCSKEWGPIIRTIHDLGEESFKSFVLSGTTTPNGDVHRNVIVAVVCSAHDRKLVNEHDFLIMLANSLGESATFEMSFPGSALF